MGARISFRNVAHFELFPPGMETDRRYLDALDVMTHGHFDLEIDLTLELNFITTNSNPFRV